MVRKAAPPKRLPDIAENWLTHLLHGKGLSVATEAAYRRTLGRLVDYLGDTPLEAATKQSLKTFCGVHLFDLGVKASSRVPAVAAVRGFYGWAHEMDILRINPAGSVEYPKGGSSLPMPVNLEAAGKMIMTPGLSSLKGQRDTAMISLLAGCGLRVSGLVALNESDLVVQTVNDAKRLAVRVVEKGGKMRLVPMPKEAQMLVLHYLSNEDLADIDRQLPNGDRVLFISLNNRMVAPEDYHGEVRRIHRRSVNNMLYGYAEVVGLLAGEVSPHKWRHLYGTEMFEAEVDPMVTQGLMGHESLDTTKGYTQVAIRRLFKDADRGNPLASINTPVSELLRRLGG